ncbi:MAG: sigma-54-dependent transcriptional regulator [Desulfovibrionales bacterium]
MRKEQNGARILVVDDDRGVRESLEEILEDDYEVSTAESGFQALEKMGRKSFDIVLMDLAMPEMDGIATLKRVREIDAGVDVIMVSATDRARQAIDAVKSGAYDYVTKPFDPDSILALIDRVTKKRAMEQELSYLRSEVADQNRFQIATQADCMRKVLGMVAKVAATSSNVLIIGESGTGKELVARALHARSGRSEKPFVAINCASIPAELIESELFGYEKGAFTGAARRTLGKFEYANEGTIFLDEIASLRMEFQAQLLRVLQEREIMRVGSNTPIKVDVRVVAATNTRLEEMVRAGTFREDLFFRLNVIPITIPPLRNRKGDVPLLVKHFLHKFNNQLHRSIKGVSKEAMAVLESYPWPGNVRELENLIERMVVLGSDGQVIAERDLPFDLLIGDHLAAPETTGETSLIQARNAFEREYILRVLRSCGWNQSDAARQLNVHRNTLLNKIKALGIREEPGV